MPAISPQDTVLVTGANGYMGRWAVRALLERGYAFHGVARTTEKAQDLSAWIARDLPAYASRFESFVVPDIAKVRSPTELRSLGLTMLCIGRSIRSGRGRGPRSHPHCFSRYPLGRRLGTVYGSRGQRDHKPPQKRSVDRVRCHVLTDAWIRTK